MRPSAVLFAILALRCYAQDRTTETGEGSIADPQIECSPYNYPPVASQSAAFPTIWQPASILPGDSAAQNLWNTIAPSVPGISPKAPQWTTNSAGFQYSPSDPDCWWSYKQCVTPKLSGLSPDISNVPEPYTTGYGFDDGPNCSHNAFYDYLASKNQKATMYYIGSNVMDWPLEAQRGLADGHEICVHTWSHRYMTSFSSPDAFAELYYSMYYLLYKASVIHNTINRSGRDPSCSPQLHANIPPFGDVDDRIRAIARGLGLQTIIWDYDSNDWRNGMGGITKTQVDSNYETFINMATDGTFSTHGGIMLTHELNNFTMSEAVEFYDKLQGAFKYIVPVGVAYNKTQPYVEKNYTQPTFEQYIKGAAAAPGNGNIGSSGTGGAAGSGSTASQKNGDTARALSWTYAGKLLAVTTAWTLLF
ncbi:hypothetical protein D9756_010602 [Leucocoprinus leucothites]|uniref:chitin deacetylase n=1 Tax=Leucocoprinus leucothites TaxID=201217 RepID=A0A8H5FRV6_9AGAR|nr:hypothetical protein D9756_010602 [Leucoagaricus leucothites]